MVVRAGGPGDDMGAGRIDPSSAAPALYRRCKRAGEESVNGRTAGAVTSMSKISHLTPDLV
jgi:hypothetical protein